MRGHVIGPLGVVHESGVAISNEIREERLNVVEHIRIGILTDHQARARMPAEYVAQTDIECGLGNEHSNLLGDLVNAATVCRNFEFFLEHAQYPLR